MKVKLKLSDVAPEVRGANYMELRGLAIGPRCNYAYQLLYVFKGEGEAEICGKGFKLRPGFLTIYGPGDMHEFRSRPDSPMTLGTVNFSWRREDARRLAMGNRTIASPGKDFKRLADPGYEVEGLPATPFTTSLPAGRRVAIERPLKEAGLSFRRSSDPAGALLRKAALLEMIHSLALHFRAARGTRGRPGVEAALDFIQRNYTSQITRADAAKAAGLSESRLTALLRQELGENFTELLGRTRMEAATELLQYSGISVKETAARCGFPDCSYFVARFRSLHGRPPGEWRAAMRA